jgi:hypothetical protein
VRADIERHLEQGFSYLVCGWPGDGADRVSEFTETEMPAYAR